ncbi:translocation/assembly module TamB domain-containing protein [Sphingosinicella rhizophila]|uniref:Translocation/assembly module TamB domain-containing protein n=1 Tax=Sphingosinicella rhizophila TaxID=3050082 RepID=A0ABU3Q8H7_9SPHN|nr:translocation/assembly module TamB domain-containing protein [Sphingosinicella sp. GR2756]MDT9599706.1 translocation/assembly module TamB domain-containing protein [Sphingosinicella sp. GR2756]
MAEVVTESSEIPIGRRRARAAVKWAGIIILGLIVLIGALLIAINSDPGRRYVVRQINNLEMVSGLDIDIGRIEGSLFGKLIVHDLRLKDPKGLFFAAPVAEMEWRPLAYLQNHIDIRTLVIPRARLMRLPELRSGDPNAPLLPDIDIDIGRFEVGRILVDPAVTGQRHLLSLGGGTRIKDGRAQVALDVAAIPAPGLAGGDKLMLRLDAVPAANQLDIGLRLDAPGDGFVAKLAGLDKPLVARVKGAGSWSNWKGRARAALAGQGLADLAIGARDGTVSLSGPTRPGLLLAEGPVQRLLQPLVQVNLVTALAERRADTRLRLNSAALAVVADGVIDLGRSRFDNFKVAARLIQPRAIAPNLTARDARIALVLNGAFATPFAAYDLKAAALGFNGTVVEGLSARGRAKVDVDRMTIPISARARRITGINAAAGGLLTNVALDGNLNISGPRVLSDDLRIRSDRINATAVVVADLERGQYRAGLQGRIDNYEVEGIGLLDLTTKLDVVATPAGFGIKGRIAAKTRRIDNSSARDFLGGNAAVAATIDMNADGVIRLDAIRLNAPQLRITSGRGTYWPDGRIDFRLSGVSTAYGPLAMVVTGTTRRPNVELRAASPGLGVGLRDVRATVRATANGYAIEATGQSQYGPFTADILILSGRGPLTIEVRTLTFAGFTFSGRVVQTPAGPFVGTLAMNGEGLSGTVRLAAEGRYQRADIQARASGARIPGENPILVQRGLIDATLILYPDAPSIVGDVQLAGVRSSNLLIRQARARVNYRGGNGQVQLVADGSSGVPFKVAANAALTPNLVRAAAQGTINRIPFRLARPAEVRKVGASWELSPTRIVLPQGNVELAGRYGDGLSVQSRIRNLDLSLLNAFSPGLGIGGKATGSLDFSQPSGGAFPRADARLTIAGFTRTGIAVRSETVDLALLGTLRPEGGALNAVIRRSGDVIGRAQARLQPVGGGAGWTERLMAAPLAGGLRYNGPADVLWSLTGIADMQLSGPIGIAADFSGRVQNPQLTGVIRANSLTFVHETYGTRITTLALQGRFTNSRLEITSLSGRAGRGTLTGQGSIGFASDQGYPVDVRLNLQNARLARSDSIGATVTGDVAITNSRAGGALISGDLQMPEVRYQVVRQGAAQVVELQGVRRKGEPLPEPGAKRDAAEAAPSIWKLDLRLRADNQIYVSGMGLESEWEADLRIRGTTTAPAITGTADLIRGTYSFSGRRFDVTSGRISFTGEAPPNPRIDITASADIEDVTVTINVDGSAQDPRIAFTSSPALPQDELLARILFGGSVTEISALQAVQLAASLNALQGGGGGLNPLGKLRSSTGLDRLRILGADETTGRGTAVAAGFYISNDIYLEIVTDARGYTATQIEVALSKSLSILSQVGSFGGSNVNLRYRKDY